MKQSAQMELVHLELQDVIEQMNNYATRRLRNIDIKQLEGKTPEDFTSDVILKVLEGTLNWLDAPTNNMKAFLMMSIKGEISNYLKKISRRDVGIFTLEDDKYNYNVNTIVYTKPYRDCSQDE
jgi:hypothetical protein